MDPKVLGDMATIVSRHVAGVKLNPDEIAAAIGQKDDDRNAAKERSYRLIGSAAVIPVEGVIAKYARQVNGCSQPRGTSVEILSRQLSEAVGDERAKRIVLHVESPGGSVAGLADLADAVYAATFSKPVIAFIDDMAASAAYWIASQASRVYANQTAMIGSIGVYTLYLDSSRYHEDAGLHFIIIRSGANKGVGNVGIPITDENVKQVQTEIDHYFSMFKTAVMRGRGDRGMTAESLDEIADGRVFIGSDAIGVRLIDGIKTFGRALSTALPKPREMSLLEETNEAATDGSQDLGPVEADFSRKSETDEVPGDKPMSGKNQDEAVAAVDGAESQSTPTDPAAEGQKERARCAKVAEILGDYPDLMKAAIADPACDETAATAKLAPVLRLELAAAKADLADRDARLEAIAKSGSDPLKAVVSDADEANPPDEKTDEAAEAARSYEALVAELKAEGKPDHRARINAAKRFPEAHEAWTKAESDRVKKKAR